MSSYPQAGQWASAITHSRCRRWVRDKLWSNLMRCRSLPCLVVLLLVLPGSVWAEDRKPPTVRVLLLGDSTVIGSVCRAIHPKADHLEDVVRKLLAAEPDLPPVEVVNRGQDGDTIHRLL